MSEGYTIAALEVVEAQRHEPGQVIYCVLEVKRMDAAGLFVASEATARSPGTAAVVQRARQQSMEQRRVKEEALAEERFHAEAEALDDQELQATLAEIASLQ